MNQALKYLLRVIKSFIWFGLFFTFLVVILALFVPEYSQGSFENALKNAFDFSGNGMFKEGSLWKIILLFSCVSIIYPALTYIKKEYSINGLFSDKRNVITGVFTEMGYEITAEDDNTVTFRKTSVFVRFMRMFEDTVILYKNDGTVTLDGPRKDLLRLGSIMQSACRR